MGRRKCNFLRNMIMMRFVMMMRVNSYMMIVDMVWVLILWGVSYGVKVIMML